MRHGGLATGGGRRELRILESYLGTGSLRGAATELHLHHSSVARRMAALSASCGWDLERPADRLRAQVAIILAHLSGG